MDSIPIKIRIEYDHTPIDGVDSSIDMALTDMGAVWAGSSWNIDKDGRKKRHIFYKLETINNEDNEIYGKQSHNEKDIKDE